MAYHCDEVTQEAECDIQVAKLCNRRSNGFVETSDCERRQLTNYFHMIHGYVICVL